MELCFPNCSTVVSKSQSQVSLRITLVYSKLQYSNYKILVYNGT